MPGQPRSFGRQQDDRPSEPVMVLPPLRLPDVQLPVVLMVDAESLAKAAGQIQEMVRAAVLGGFNLAMDEVAQMEADAEAADGLGILGQPRT